MTANGFRAENQELRAEVSRMENTITALRAENERLRSALEAWNNAVRVHPIMEKPVFISVSSTLGRLAWEKTRAALEEK